MPAWLSGISGGNSNGEMLVCWGDFMSAELSDSSVLSTLFTLALTHHLLSVLNGDWMTSCLVFPCSVFETTSGVMWFFRKTQHLTGQNVYFTNIIYIRFHISKMKISIWLLANMIVLVSLFSSLWLCYLTWWKGMLFIPCTESTVFP